MITHGNKQISEIVYARKASEGGGAVRLTNIICGAQVVFGELYSYVNGWLNGTTMTAILAAFGHTDGKAVIKATNAYLNGIAATDKTKASALAGFINGDPMMVCSLGLQPQGVEMPIRWLVGDGNAYAETGVTYNTANNYKAQFALLFTKKNVGAYQLNGINAGAAFGEMNGRLDNGSNKSSIPCEINTVYNVTQYYNATSATCDIDGVGTLTRSTSLLPQWALTYGYVLFGCRSKEEVIYLCNEKMQYFNMEVNNVIVREMYPMQRTDGTCGMIDTISGTFYPNANTSGSFSIEYTLPDVTPWTPLNQTP